MESNTPPSKQQQIQITPQNTPSSTPTNLVQKPSIAVGANMAGTHTTLSATAFPALSTADWVRLAQINPVMSCLIPQSTNQPLLMAPPDPPKKTQGQPRKQPAPQRSNSLCLSQPLPDHEAQNKRQMESQNETQNEAENHQNKAKDITRSKNAGIHLKAMMASQTWILLLNGAAYMRTLIFGACKGR
ncbi:hypothetical protein DFH28DRAFT_1134628 [Melampsora americana]|nr:hypothetical protein DFH28DRAFT_1134628 [Melampsora americana]